MKKCRKEDDNILFIDASKEFEKVKTQNKLRPQHIQKIVETYRDRKEIEKYSHLATLQEVAENDYNLNIPRYVDNFEKEEDVDLNALLTDMKKTDEELEQVQGEFLSLLKELTSDDEKIMSSLHSLVEKCIATHYLTTLSYY